MIINNHEDLAIFFYILVHIYSIEILVSIGIGMHTFHTNQTLYLFCTFLSWNARFFAELTHLMILKVKDVEITRQ